MTGLVTLPLITPFSQIREVLGNSEEQLFLTEKLRQEALQVHSFVKTAQFGTKYLVERRFAPILNDRSSRSVRSTFGYAQDDKR